MEEEAKQQVNLVLEQVRYRTRAVHVQVNLVLEQVRYRTRVVHVQVRSSNLKNDSSKSVLNLVHHF